MQQAISFLCLLCALLVPGSAFAQAPDRIAFGHDVYVAAGEVVHDAVSFGGDTVIEGTVEGDAISFGGSVRIREGAIVNGEAVSLGGTVESAGQSIAVAGADVTDGVLSAEHAATGLWETVGSWLGETARSAVMHVLLFLIGLLMIGAGRQRLGAMQVTMVRDGLKTAGMGLLGYVAAIGAIVLFTITLIGIPAAIVIGLAVPVATYIGLAAAASVLGAALPIPQFQGKEVHQLAAGVAVLFMASLVPVAGGIATAGAACLGVGALLRTRFGTVPPADLPHAEGPYRTSAA